MASASNNRFLSLN